VNKLFNILLIYLFITGCSFQKNSKFWNKEKILEEKQENITEIFKKKKKLKL
jgi:hypothetical protein